MKSKEFKKTIKDASLEQLKQMLSDLNQTLVNSKFNISLNQSKDNAIISKTRKQIAVIKTELTTRVKTAKAN